MTVIRLARSELQRMTSGLLPKLVILALTMVPLLYGAVYLYANWDPYSNMGHIKAALVVEDRGATTPDGSRLEAGAKVADSLVERHVFDWQRVPDVQTAEAGVRNGTYSFALRIPAEFSSNLASPASFDAAKQAMLDVTTNDANNYLLSTIVDKVTKAVHDSVAKEVGTETANKLLTGYGTIHTQMVQAADAAGQLRDGAGQVADGANRLADGTAQLRTGAAQLADGQQRLLDGSLALRDGAGQLAGGLDTLQRKTASLPADTQKLADGAAQVAAGNAVLSQKLQGAATAADAAQAQLQQQVSDSLATLVANGTITPAQAQQVGAQLGAATQSPTVQGAAAQLHAAAGQVAQLAAGSQQVADGARQLANGMPALTSAIGQADAGAHQVSAGAAQLADGEQAAVVGSRQLADGAAQADDGAQALAAGAAKAHDGAAQLADALAAGSGKVPNPSSAQKDNLSQVIADPVAVNSVSQAKAATYGAGLAPFFLSLAMWVGIFMLTQAMRPVTKRALASNAPAWKIAIGGWLPFALVAAAQATVLTAVVDFGLGLQPAHPWLMWLFIMLGGIAFSALIQGIVSLLGSAGKFVVLILLILQLVSSGGTFPWEMAPAPFQVAHAVLPMGYVVTGMRHLIYGGDLSGILPLVAGLVGYTLAGAALNILGTRRNMTWRLKTLQPEIAV
ncbi:YhgE/Pip domain-containing protein [Sinomonas sp. JGH33]|uniref:YhgE/Pip domain-containing protein n=1 Tax=Sinomonas terricola TaxID=3110330 RepID=A0ABU5T9L5_9MICC|nr:YhgE/Pip domain-containing protein [Sinomonas sp. JGH33]MEA5456376.1 YhgE/Pip domain-containing protein [Sinomonas sp. JGH33]